MNEENKPATFKWLHVSLILATLSALLVLAAIGWVYVRFMATEKYLANTIETQTQKISQLEKDLNALHAKVIEDALPQNELNPIYMRLQTVDAALNQLSVRIKTLGTPPAISPAAVISEPWWQRGLKQTWQELQRIVVVRHEQTNAPPFITPDQKDFLLQNCHAMVQQAIWGLLHNNQDIYQTSLKILDRWLRDYFVWDAATQNVSADIVALSNEKFSVMKK